MPRGPVPNPQAGAWHSAWGPVVHSLEGPSVSQSAPLSSKALGPRTPIQAGLVPTAQPRPRGLRGQARGALPWGRGARGFREPRTLTFRGGCPAASKRDCLERFGARTLERITRDDDVICTTEYSRIVPLENGEVGPVGQGRAAAGRAPALGRQLTTPTARRSWCPW